MSRPPKVSAALLRQHNKTRATSGPGVAATRQAASESHFAVAQMPDTTKSTGVARHPLGVLPNSLPEVWAAKPPSGGLWIMRESSDGPTCLAMIRPEDWQDIQASRKPILLLPHAP